MLDPCQNPQLLTKMGLSADRVRTFLCDFGHTFFAEPDASVPSSSTHGHDGFGKMAPSTIKPLFYDEKSHTSIDSTSPLTFTVFIQYTDYAGFAAAMEALRGKKLIYAPNDKNNTDSPKFFSAEIKVGLLFALFNSPISSLLGVYIGFLVLLSASHVLWIVPLLLCSFSSKALLSECILK